MSHLPPACGLYYAAELAEEYPSVAKKVIAWATAGVILVHVALLVEGFPLVTIATGVACHLAYSLLLITFPFLEILSFKSLLALGKSPPKFAPVVDILRVTKIAVVCCTWANAVAIVLDHYVWFQFFKVFHFDIFKTMVRLISHTGLSASCHSRCALTCGYPVLPLQALFFLLVWLVPFALFISLTVTDQTIPMSVGTPLPATRKHYRH